ncbi:response regulator [Proteocatella sphenisci]|uniref:response regulator n=1 Tax=Proteocatella sphenisci TaxID=181070 RepID=UPI00048FC8B3|nr:response regulator [Proteocatella sphenisci]
MNVGLCTAFLEEDVWASRLLVAALPQKLEITNCNNVQALLRILELKTFSLLIVALNGVTGLETVRQLWEKAPEVPILWISDEDYSLFGYQYRVSRFLCKPVSDIKLSEAVAGCLMLFGKGEENKK